MPLRRGGCVSFSRVMTGKVCFYSSSSSVGSLQQTISQPHQFSFHKRPLPDNLISLSSSQGKKLFREALEDGGMESFFPLAEQFVTQSEPSYCALSTLAMVMNALEYDPKKIWKTPWRWVSEEMLQCDTEAICGHSLDKVRKHGLNFLEFESLAKCHGVKIISKRACHSNQEECGKASMDEFQALVQGICSTDKAKTFVVSNYSRKYLKQTGKSKFRPSFICTLAYIFIIFR
jgi:glutathione gamma-glutamylcysteinyltransferase